VKRSGGEAVGSLYKRGEVWWIKYYQYGRPIRESTGTGKETEARKFLKLREGQVVQGKRARPRAERLSFEELAADFLLDYQINRRRSLDKAKVSVRRLQEVAGWRAVHIPTASLYSALCLTPFSVRQIGTVIAPLHPGHKLEDRLNRIRAQG